MTAAAYRNDHLTKSDAKSGRWKREGDRADIYGNFEDSETGDFLGTTAGHPMTDDCRKIDEVDDMENHQNCKMIVKGAFPCKTKSTGKDGTIENDASVCADVSNPLSYFDYVKDALQGAHASKTQMSELDRLPDTTLEALEGYRPGSYLRLVLRSVPREWVVHFNPIRPILINGGLLASEDSFGYQHLRLKAQVVRKSPKESRSSHLFNWLAQISVDSSVLCEGLVERSLSHDKVYSRTYALSCNYLWANDPTEYRCREVPVVS